MLNISSQKLYKITFLLFPNVSFYQKVNTCSKHVFANDLDLTWDVHVLVLDTNCVDTHFLGDELNAVVVVIQTDNVTEFCQARGAGDWSGHVERTGSYRHRNREQIRDIVITAMQKSKDNFGIIYFKNVHQGKIQTLLELKLKLKVKSHNWED